MHHPDLSDVRAEDHPARSWTANEDKRLARLVRQGKTPNQIAVLLGRGYHLVQSRIRILKLTLSEKQRLGRFHLHLSSRPISEVAEIVQSSSTWVEAARKAHVMVKTVRLWGAKHGVTPQAPRTFSQGARGLIQKKRNTAIIAAWRSGANVRDLADKHSLSRASIYLIIQPARQP